MFIKNAPSIGSMHYDAASQQYWTYGHLPRPEEGIKIYRAVHSDFSRQLGQNDFVEVISGKSLGLTATTNVESLGFAVNAP